jgi:hypothetical protein
MSDRRLGDLDLLHHPVATMIPTHQQYGCGWRRRCIHLQSPTAPWDVVRQMPSVPMAAVSQLPNGAGRVMLWRQRCLHPLCLHCGWQAERALQPGCHVADG